MGDAFKACFPSGLRGAVTGVGLRSLVASMPRSNYPAECMPVVFVLSWLKTCYPCPFRLLPMSLPCTNYSPLRPSHAGAPVARMARGGEGALFFCACAANSMGIFCSPASIAGDVMRLQWVCLVRASRAGASSPPSAAARLRGRGDVFVCVARGANGRRARDVFRAAARGSWR